MTVVRYQADDQPAERWVQLMAPAVELAKAVANTDFVPAQYRGKPAEITAAIMYGDEVGLGPLQSLAKIAVINGRPTLAAEAQRALIQAAGHEIWVEEATVTRVTVGGRRKDSDRSQLFTWTLDDAKRAGIAGKQPWRQYPRAMLLARATAELARAIFADVIGGLAATEEIEDAPIEPAANSTGAAETPPASPQRRRRPARPPTTAVIAPAPPAADEPAPPALPDETPAETPGASDAQRRKLFALFNDRGIQNDRTERLAWINQRIDRIITSTSELTDIEASALIDELEQQPATTPPDEPPLEKWGSPDQTTLDVPADGDTILDVTPERVDIIQHLRREAGVSDTWMRDKLVALGLTDVPSRVAKSDIGRLSKAQARQLSDALSTIIDQRDE